MKTIKIFIATGLALLTLAGVTLALTWQPTISRADQIPDGPNAPAAPLILPGPFLSDDDVVDAPFDNPPPPTVDGLIAPGEYAGAGKVVFAGYGGYYHDVEVFFKHDAITLYVAFELPDKTNALPLISLSLDTNHDGGSAPQTDDFEFRVQRDGTIQEYQGDGSYWTSNTPITWTYGLTETMSGWSVEFGIPFSKLGIVAGTFKELGLMLNNWDAGPPNLWPDSAISNQPDTWGSLVSSSDWTTFYWKPGPWEDYAPSGMPDFDQRQNGWFLPGAMLDHWTHDGPVAVANSFWWFDSKFETLTGTMPPVISDTYRLVTSYAISPTHWDDHHYSNTVPLVNDLAWYFDTNGVQSGMLITGTDPVKMFHGIHNYLRNRGLWDDYIVTLVQTPTFEWVADEVMRSEDVILLLGVYDWHGDHWQRVGGHYVNVAGVDPMAGLIAFSDPALDNTEYGGLGRVLSGTLLHHIPIPGHPVTVHNDAGNVSHDIYASIVTTSPGGIWGPEFYPIEDVLFGAGAMGANPHPYITTSMDYWGMMTAVEVEFALAVSPYTWKSSGEWIPKEDDDPVNGVWQQWLDYAPNGVPDFDQKQDNWQSMLVPGKWTFCGPVAAANSLWWFDSKFEPIPIPPLASNDNYPLVQTYDPTGLWDDHDPLNVDNPLTPWPPGGVWPPPFPPPMPPGMGEFVEDLALYFQTDMPPGSNGTHIFNMYTGIDQYIINHGLRQGYVITMVESPDFWWIAEEVEVSEDVILLIGFWEEIGLGEYQRVGGHYVTVPGVDKQGGLVAFSDPWYDGVEFNWPYAYPAGWPTVMGRVADGWQPGYTHIPKPHAVYTLHNDAGNVSHDVYYVGATDSPGGVWGPREYVEGGFLEPNFLEQNGETVPWGGGPVQAEVDGAIAVSPVADVWVTKDVNTDTVEPGDWLTFTIRFSNDGSLPAEGVVITDDLSSALVNPSWRYWTSNGLTVTARPGATYAWDIPDLAWMEWGTITITAQLDPGFNGSGRTTITNTVGISTTSIEQYQVPELPNTAQVTFTALNIYDVDLTPDAALKYGSNGDTVVFDLVLENAGNASDSFNLAMAGNNWSSTLSTASVGPLASNVTAALRLSVTVPGTAVAFSYDQVTVTAQSVASPTVSDSSVFTTEVIALYDMSLDPPTASFMDNPSKTVTYTLDIYNTGNVTDTYDVTITLAAWTTSLSALTVGPIAPWNNESFEVYVTIPASAVNGAQDVVTVTATSQGAPGLSDYSILTTVATMQIITRGVEIAPPTDAKSGDIGSDVVYHLTVTNTGSTTDSITLSASGNAWPTVVSPTNLSLSNGASSPVIVTATIPSGASGGQFDTATITAQATGVSDSSILTTTAISVCTPITSVEYDWTPYYPDAGEVVTFSLYSLSPATATLPITYTWDFDDGHTGSGIPITHTYAISGSYWVQLTATNPCSQRYSGHTVDVTGEPDISVTPMALSTALDPDDTTTAPLTVTNAATATANLNWSLAENPNAGWLNATPLTGIVAPGGDSSISVAFDAAGMTPGIYTTTIEIASNDPDEPLVRAPVTLTVNCVEVTSVTLDITSAGTIYTNTTVHFSADVEPLNASAPYTYIAETDAGMSTGQITTTTIPITFNDIFGITGTHAATITVWNCNQLPIYAISDTITFTVRALGECVELDEITIDGDDSGYPGTYTFTTDYDPFDASLPITYTWDNGDDTYTSVRSLDVGTHTLTVSATNLCTVPPVTDTHEIVITAAPVCTEVTGITLEYTPTGAIYTDTVVHFRADIAPDDADVPYTYTIDYGSGPTLPNIAAVDPYLFTYTFPITGTHTVTFSAWNCAMVVPESDSASVTVSAYGGQNFIYLPLVLRNYSP